MRPTKNPELLRSPRVTAATIVVHDCYSNTEQGIHTRHMRIFGALKNIARRIQGKTIMDAQTEDELEEALLESDVAFETVDKILTQVRDSKAHSDGVQAGLQEVLINMMSDAGNGENANRIAEGPTKPTVIFVAGVNGVGKTTSIAKLAYRYQKQGKDVLLAAADTFRAAAIDQLEIWAERIGCQIVKHGPGADPAAVVFDSVSAAIARGTDVVIVDTAGRLHTKSNLMEELKKITRAVEKANGRPPDETLLVLDATTGQNAVSQATEFLNAIHVTGLVLAKMDSSARGGTVISIRDALGVPVKLIGTGEQLDDLEEFDPAEFVKQMFE